MIQRRPFNQLAPADRGWLEAKHHFAFGEFADPTQLGCGAPRVWNDDKIAPTSGFPPYRATRIFQIWTMSTQGDGSTAWGSQPFPNGDRSGRPVTLASGIYRDTDAPPIRADAHVLGAPLEAGESVDYALGNLRRGYLVPVGAVQVNATGIEARDGAAIKDAAVIKITAIDDSVLVVADTP